MKENSDNAFRRGWDLCGSHGYVYEGELSFPSCVCASLFRPFHVVTKAFFVWSNANNYRVEAYGYMKWKAKRAYAF